MNGFDVWSPALASSAGVQSPFKRLHKIRLLRKQAFGAFSFISVRASAAAASKRSVKKKHFRSRLYASKSDAFLCKWSVKSEIAVGNRPCSKLIHPSSFWTGVRGLIDS